MFEDELREVAWQSQAAGSKAMQVAPTGAPFTPPMSARVRGHDVAAAFGECRLTRCVGGTGDGPWGCQA